MRSALGPPSTSGRCIYHTPCNLNPLPKLHLCNGRARTTAVVRALYNFADAAEVKVPGQRRNRTSIKKEAREVLDLVRGLTAMTPKQLGAVEHLLPPGTAEAVGIAARLPRSNQGRKRQEALVAKMLRGQLSEGQADKLEEAIAMAEQNSGLFEDGDVAGMVEGWREGLLAEEQDVVAEVYGYPREWAPDHQQLRTLVRQCQQALEEEGRSPDGAGAGDASSGGGSGSDADEDAELAAVLAEARARSGVRQPSDAADAGGGGGGGASAGKRRKAAEPRSRGVLRSLNRMLRSLAKRVVQEEGLSRGDAEA